MSNLFMMHNVQSITTNGVNEFSQNAVTFKIMSGDFQELSFTVLGLPLEDAKRINDALDCMNDGDRDLAKARRERRDAERKKIASALALAR